MLSFFLFACFVFLFFFFVCCILLSFFLSSILACLLVLFLSFFLVACLLSLSLSFFLSFTHSFCLLILYWFLYGFPLCFIGLFQFSFTCKCFTFNLCNLVLGRFAMVETTSLRTGPNINEQKVSLTRYGCSQNEHAPDVCMFFFSIAQNCFNFYFCEVVFKKLLTQCPHTGATPMICPLSLWSHSLQPKTLSIAVWKQEGCVIKCVQYRRFSSKSYHLNSKIHVSFRVWPQFDLSSSIKVKSNNTKGYSIGTFLYMLFMVTMHLERSITKI